MSISTIVQFSVWTLLRWHWIETTFTFLCQALLNYSYTHLLSLKPKGCYMGLFNFNFVALHYFGYLSLLTLPSKLCSSLNWFSVSFSPRVYKILREFSFWTCPGLYHTCTLLWIVSSIPLLN